MEIIKTIKQKKLSDAKYIGLIRAKDWFQKDGLAFIFPMDFVVCEWSDFTDGVNSHIEGKTTIGIFRNQEDAEIIYNNRSLALSSKFPSEAEIDEMANLYSQGETYVYAGINMVKKWLRNRGLL